MEATQPAIKGLEPAAQPAEPYDGKAGERGNLKRRDRSGQLGTMAAGPGVSMQGGSPARELSLSVKQGGNQTHGERIKSEEVTGKNMIAIFFRRRSKLKSIRFVGQDELTANIADRKTLMFSLFTFISNSAIS